MDNSLSEKIELFLSCRNLKDLDVMSKSDPYIRVSFRRDYSQKQYAVIGKTQTIQNNLNPNFAKSFPIDYYFEMKQDIKFDLFDDDGNGDNDDYIGTIQTTVGALMGAKSQTSILDLKNPSKNNEFAGKLVVRCQKIKDSNQYLSLKIRAQKLQNVDSFFDFWDKSDPYLKFIKIRDDGSYIQIQRTEIIKDNLDPVWRPIEIQGARLINPNKQQFKIQIWDWEQDGNDQFMGQAFVSPNDLKNGSRLKVSHPKKADAGALIIDNFALITRPTFVDYLRGGLQLNMIVAIDFTGSNGLPKFPNSLHYMNLNAPNQYQSAILSIAGILLNYDSDKRIPALGFGAKTNFNNVPSQGVSHCFPLGGNMQNLQAAGLQALMSLYKNALTHVQLSGPTYFGPLIQQTMSIAAQCKQQGSMVYQTLLILTDGQIHDMDQTIDLIIQAATLPLSIIIVGVGNADFASMNRLDGDNGGLFNSNGQKSPRDVVQFVAFRDMQLNADLLSKELLAELPLQVVQYMSMIGKPPGQFVPLNVENQIKKAQ